MANKGLMEAIAKHQPPKKSEAEIRADADAQRAAAEKMIAEFGEHLPESVFEFILLTAEKLQQTAHLAAKGLDFLSCSPRDLARQRRMNMMVDDFIIMIEELCNVTVDVNRHEQTGRVPFPPEIDHLHTMLNFKNHR